MPRRLKIFFDGGLRPGGMEVAVVAGGQVHVLRDLGLGTSTDAEWLALIHAAGIARSLGAVDAVLLGDCADVVAKANGRVACRGAGIAHLETFRGLTADTAVCVRYIKRSQNLAGIALARQHVRVEGQ